MSPAAVGRFRVIGGIVWIVLGVALLGVAIREFVKGLRPGSQLFELCAAGFCLLTGITVLKLWSLGRWLAGLGGIVAGLYAVVLVVLGTEDVGGLAVSLPSGLALVAFSVWNLAAA